MCYHFRGVVFAALRLSRLRIECVITWYLFYKALISVVRPSVHSLFSLVYLLPYLGLHVSASLT